MIDLNVLLSRSNLTSKGGNIGELSVIKWAYHANI